MAADVGNHRIEVSDFVVGSRGVQTSPLEMTAGRESLGVGMGLTPNFVIDVNDQYRFTGVIAGQRSDGMGTLEYVAATYTARGMATPPADRYSPAGPSDPASPLRRGYHLTVSNARAIGISGPTRRR